MKVTPTKKTFNRHRPGEVFELPDRAAKALIKAGILKEPEAQGGPVQVMPGPLIGEAGTTTYQTRAMQAAPAAEPVIAPYGYKADGTPRLRPAPPPRNRQD